MKFFEKRWLHGYSFMTLLAKTKQQQGKSKTARLSDEHKRASYLAYFSMVSCTRSNTMWKRWCKLKTSRCVMSTGKRGNRFSAEMISDPAC